MRNWLILPLLLTALPLQAAAGGQLRQGSKLYSQKKYGQALAAYNEALKKDPQNESAAFGAGASAYYLKDYKTAARDFEQVVTQNGVRSQDALFNLGNTYYRAGQKEKAIQFYRQAILKNPQDKEAIHNLQLILQEDRQQQNNQDNKNDKNKDSDNSANQNKNEQNDSDGNKQDPSAPEQPSADPQEEQKKQEEQDTAQRVLQMARENEQKPRPSSYAQPQIPVEKDW